MMNIMTFFPVTFCAFALIPSCYCEEHYGIVTVTACSPGVPENVTLNQDFYAIGDINGILKEKPPPESSDPDYPKFYCEGHDKTLIVELTFFVHGGPPSLLTLQIADSFVPKLESSIITCLYADISPSQMVDMISQEDVAHTSGDWMYFCDGVGGLQVNLKGIPISSFTTAPATSKSGHEVLKRSTTSGKIPVDKIRCSNGMYTTEPDKNKPFYLLGQLCRIRDDPYRTQIGRVWMFNSVGEPDCLTCCVDHHWDNITKKECVKCPEGTKRPLPNIFRTCLKNEDETPESTKAVTSIPDFTLQDKVPTGDSSATPAPDQKKLPVLKPRGLKVKANSTHAVIQWDPVPDAEFQPVTKYNVTFSKLSSNEPRYIKTNVTNVTLSDLDPATWYYISIQAGNTAGFGPNSESLEFRTLHKLEVPDNVEYVIGDGLVIITYTPRPWEVNLTIKVEYQQEGFSTIHETDSKANGEISFPLIGYGIYHVEIFYINEDQYELFDGKESEPVQIRVNYEEETIMTKAMNAAEVFVIIVAVLAFLVFLVIAIGLIMSKNKKSGHQT